MKNYIKYWLGYIKYRLSHAGIRYLLFKGDLKLRFYPREMKLIYDFGTFLYFKDKKHYNQLYIMEHCGNRIFKSRLQMIVFMISFTPGMICNMLRWSKFRPSIFIQFFPEEYIDSFPTREEFNLNVHHGSSPDSPCHSDAHLKEIENWDIKKAYALITRLRCMWRYKSRFIENWGLDPIHKKNPILLLELHTGGWSGNEGIIESLKNHKLFWAMWWLKTEKGGHYYFEIDFSAIGFKLLDQFTKENKITRQYVLKAKEKFDWIKISHGKRLIRAIEKGDLLMQNPGSVHRHNNENHIFRSKKL